MSTKVTTIDILRAFYRWNPLDVKQLFLEELTEEVAAKEKRIEELVAYLDANKYNSIGILKKMHDMSALITSLKKEHQFIREINIRLYSEGKDIIEELKRKIRRLHKELVDTKQELNARQTEIDSLNKIKLNSDQTDTDLHNECQSDSSSQQSLVATKKSDEEMIKTRIESISGEDRRLSKALVRRVIELESENSKLKHQIKLKGDSICDSDKGTQTSNNEAMDEVEDDIKVLKEFLQRLSSHFADRYTQTDN